MTVYEAAKKYTELGWVVLPINPGRKNPALTTWKEYETRRPTDEELKEWFEDKEVGIGVLCGRLSGICVVDLDSYKKESGIDLDTPLKAKTGGGGSHGYFKYTNGVSKNIVNRELAVDIKTEGGFVVLPPTVHPSGKKYEWNVKGKLTEIIKNLPELPKEIYESVKARPDYEPISYTDSVGVEEGGRNDALYRLACSFISRDGAGKAFPAIEKINRTYQPPLPDFEVKQLFESAREFIESQAPASVEEVSSNNNDDWPEPLAEEAYYGLAEEFTKLVGPNTEADENVLLLSFLTVFGSVAGNSAFVLTEADKQTARLFAGIVGKSSEGTKGTGFGWVKKVFREVDPKWHDNNIKGGLSSGEGLVEAVKDDRIKITTNDDGIEEREIKEEGVADKRLLAYEDEFGSTLRVMRREGNIISARLRQAWDHGNIATLTRLNPIKATNAHISIVAHCTPEELRNCITEVDLLNGFANRFLWACSRRSKLLPRGGNLKDSDLAFLVQKVKQSVAFAQTTDEVVMSEEAWTLWESIYPDLVNRPDNLFGTLTARVRPQIIRLALIYALLDMSDVIEPKHIYPSLAVWDYCEASVKYIFRGLVGDSLANKILETLPKTRTEIYNHFDRHISSERISAALEVLKDEGRAVSETTETKGRYTTLWRRA